MRSLRACAAAVLLALALAPAALAQDLANRYRVEGVAADAHRTSGEIELARDGDAYFATRRVDAFPSGCHYELSGNIFTNADGRLELALSATPGITGALSDEARPASTGHYRPDGRGGFVGRYDGPEGGLEETLAPLPGALPGDAAAVDSGLTILEWVDHDPAKGDEALEDAIAACDVPRVDVLVSGLAIQGILTDVVRRLTAGARETLGDLEVSGVARERLATAALSDHPGAADAELIYELAQGARSDSIEASRAFLDGLVSRNSLYATLDIASREDRAAIAAIASEVSPPDPSAEENAPFESALAARRSELARSKYAVIIVPGYTPTDAPRLHEISSTAKDRCARAFDDWKHGRAPFILTSGGSVYPESTPVVEALELKAELVRLGVPADRIAVEPRARHSTTNLRNAGRFMIAHGFAEGLIVTSPDQSFYFSEPDISTFTIRCEKELGYRVGDLGFVDLWRTGFRPSRKCLTIDPSDPFDP
jgi:hypothetical protein